MRILFLLKKWTINSYQRLKNFVVYKNLFLMPHEFRFGFCSGDGKLNETGRNWPRNARGTIVFGNSGEHFAFKVCIEDSGLVWLPINFVLRQISFFFQGLQIFKFWTSLLISMFLSSSFPGTLSIVMMLFKTLLYIFELWLLFSSDEVVKRNAITLINTMFGKADSESRKVSNAFPNL